MSKEDKTKTKTKTNTKTLTDNWDFSVSESSIELALKKEKENNAEKIVNLKKLELDDSPRVKNVTREEMYNELQGKQDLTDLNIYASYLKRSVAYIIDTFFLGTIIVISKKLIVFNYFITSFFMNRYHLKWMLPFDMLDKIMWTLNFSILFLFLVIIPLSFYYVTLGKKIMGIYLRGEEQFSLPIEVVIVRELILKPISLVTLIGIFLPFFNKKKKSLHDFILKTIVVVDD